MNLRGAVHTAIKIADRIHCPALIAASLCFIL